MVRHLDNSTAQAIRARKAERNFSNQAIPEELFTELLELSNRAPSGYNLQPWHFVVVRDAHLRQLLCHVALNQRQVLEAPAVVVFVADPLAWKTSYPGVLQSGALPPRVVEMYRKNVELLFQLGPLNMFGLAKRVAVPLRRFLRPTPNLITSSGEAVHYVREQTIFAAATFMIAASSFGLATSPMEGFDEVRLKKLLSIPSHMTVPLIVAVGYSATTNSESESYRLNLKDKIHLNQFSKKHP